MISSNKIPQWTMMKTTSNKRAMVMTASLLLVLVATNSFGWAQERTLSKEAADRLFSVEVMPLLRQKDNGF